MAKENQFGWMHLRLYLYCVERCYRDAPIPNSPEFQMEPHQQCKQARFCQLSHKANYQNNVQNERVAINEIDVQRVSGRFPWQVILQIEPNEKKQK